MEGVSPFDKRVESLKCRGLCIESCELIPYPERIRNLYPDLDLPGNAREVARRTFDGKKPCPFFKDLGCSIYSIRPAICRLWGNTKRMQCPYGCEREGPFLRYYEGFYYLRAHDEGKF